MKKLLIALLFTLPAYANVGTVIILKGNVTSQYKGKMVKLKKGSKVKVGSQIRTRVKSFAKILFPDKTSIVVSPQSEIIIQAYKSGKSGIITLIKGGIRSRVRKNPSKRDIKFIIRTKTAAMGVRGTEFTVNYYDKTKRTALVTISGEVVMVKVPKRIKGLKQLKRWLSKKTAVSVKRGQYSAVTPGKVTPSKPIKVSPMQIRSLERNELPTTTKKFRDPSMGGAKGFVAKVEKHNNAKSAPRIDFNTGLTVKRIEGVKPDLSKVELKSKRLTERSRRKVDQAVKQSVLDIIRRKRAEERERNTVVGRGKTKLKLKIDKQ